MLAMMWSGTPWQTPDHSLCLVRAFVETAPCGSPDDLRYTVQELRLVQKTDKQGKNVMWCFVEFEEIVQAARCMKVLQVRLTSACIIMI